MASRRVVAMNLAMVLILSSSIGQFSAVATEAHAPPTAGLELGAERRPEIDSDLEEDPEGLLHPPRFGRFNSRLRPFADPHIYVNVRAGQNNGDYVSMDDLRQDAVGDGPNRDPNVDIGGGAGQAEDDYIQMGGLRGNARGHPEPNEPYYANMGQNRPDEGPAVEMGNDNSEEPIAGAGGSLPTGSGSSSGSTPDVNYSGWESDTSGESFHFEDEEEPHVSHADDLAQPNVDSLNDDVSPDYDAPVDAGSNSQNQPFGPRYPQLDDVVPQPASPIAPHGRGRFLGADDDIPFIDAPGVDIYGGTEHGYEMIESDTDELVGPGPTYETIPPALPDRNSRLDLEGIEAEASGGAAAEEKAVEYVYLCSTQKVSEIKRIGGVFPRGYRPPQSGSDAGSQTGSSFDLDDYFHGEGQNAYVVTYEDLPDAAQVAAEWTGGGKVRIWKVKTTPNMFPESSISGVQATIGERYLAFGGIHKGQMAGYYKLGNEPAQRIQGLRNGVPPKESGFKYVANRGYRPVTYANERNVLPSEMADETRAELRAMLKLPACRERSGGPSKRSIRKCVWRGGDRDLEKGSGGNEDLEVEEGEDVDLSDAMVEEGLDGPKAEKMPLSEAGDTNLYDEPFEKMGVSVPESSEAIEAKVLSGSSDDVRVSAQLERTELAAVVDGFAAHTFKDLVKQLKLKIPKYFNGPVANVASLRRELVQVASIKTWSSRYSGGALWIALTTTYVYDMIRAWREESATELEKVAVTLSLLPVVGCSFKAMVDRDHGAISPIGTSLCFVGDILLFTPLAPVAVLIRAIGSVVDHAEQNSVDFIVQQHDAGWRKHYSELEHTLQSETFRLNVSDRYATEMAVIAFQASEQMGMLEASRQIASRRQANMTQADGLELEATTARAREEVKQKMCGDMRYKKLWFERWLPVVMAYHMRDQATNYTAIFMDRQTDKIMADLDTAQTMASITDFHYPQPPSQAEARKAAVEAKLRKLGNALGYMKRVEIEIQAQKIQSIVTNLLTTLNFALPDLCDCPSQVKEIQLLTALRDSRDKLEAALLCATSRGYHDVVDYILQKALYTTDINAVDEDGNSALLLAVANGRTDMAARLLHAGADPNLANKHGQTLASLGADSEQNGVATPETKRAK
ncbi:hypothetical protein XA68_13084 [Ophiocordyceps unilateralis]|uniref:Uncharacterized protein n=1 Tax=Ophiocordyceps unilateralis TaxID=268505 RepID=A0A2A9PC67_OPHUN|nr:hypothetical protein XA68_13084 [Ophiocordyceps unilateralis]